MSEPRQKSPQLGDESKAYRVETNGENANVLLTEHAMHYMQNGGSTAFMLEPEALILAKLIMDRPNMPFLASHLKDFNQFNDETTVPQKYKKLVHALGASSLRKHFVHIGHGSATWYGFLPNNSEPEEFVNNGERIIKATVRGSHRQSRALRHFDAFSDYYSDKKDPRFTKRQIIGAAMTTICIGGTYIFARHYKKA